MNLRNYIPLLNSEAVEAMQEFGTDKELTETRRQAGAIIERCNDTDIRRVLYKLPRPFYSTLEFEISKSTLRRVKKTKCTLGSRREIASFELQMNFLKL